MGKITEEIETIITPILDDLNFELVDAEYAEKGKDRFLRTSIDKGDGVDLNDYALASEKISEAVDQNDPIPEMYYLGVASPGTERPLKKEKDYQNTIEQPVFVSLCVPIEGGKEWLGALKPIDDDTVTMEVREKSKKKTTKIPRSKIAKARHIVMIWHDEEE